MEVEFKGLITSVNSDVRLDTTHRKDQNGEYSVCCYLKATPGGFEEMMQVDDNDDVRPYGSEECQAALGADLLGDLQREGRFVIWRWCDGIFIQIAHNNRLLILGPLELDGDFVLIRFLDPAVGTVLHKSLGEFLYHYRHYFKELVACVVEMSADGAQLPYPTQLRTARDILHAWNYANEKNFRSGCQII